MTATATKKAGTNKKPAKKKLEKVVGPLAVVDKPVDFGGVSIGKTTGRIGVSFGREWLELGEAAEFFCNRRLSGKVVLGRADDAAGQTTLVDDLDCQVAGAFDVKGFRVTEEVISAGLTFSLAEVDIAELAKFSKGVGRLVIFEVGEIPDDAAEEDFVDDDDLPILKAEGEWAEVKLDTLFDGALLKSLNKAGIKTVGDLAERTGNEWWAKDIPGIGPAKRQQIEDVMEKFWAANPQT